MFWGGLNARRGRSNKRSGGWTTVPHQGMLQHHTYLQKQFETGGKIGSGEREREAAGQECLVHWRNFLQAELLHSRERCWEMFALSRVLWNTYILSCVPKFSCPQKEQALTKISCRESLLHENENWSFIDGRIRKGAGGQSVVSCVQSVQGEAYNSNWAFYRGLSKLLRLVHSVL